MQRVVFLVPFLVVGSLWTLQMDPVLGKTPVTTLENFDFEQFSGRWYEVAVVSTCPHYTQRKKSDPVIVALELKHVPSQHNFTMTSSTFKNGTCRETLTVISLTSIPGRFFHHVARFGADVDCFVVDTNYNEYALMLQLSTEKPSGNKTTIVKLYSRTTSVSPLVLGKFKALIRLHGISEDTAIMNQHKEERWCHCVAHLMDKVQDKWTQSSDKMQKSVVLVSLLVLGWMWTPQGLPVLPDPLYSTQENFDLSKFLGTWHDVAKASTCPYMQRHRGDLAIGKLVLQKSTTEGKLKMTRRVLRTGTCKERTGDYELTSTPGRFFYHVAKWGADVDAYVVHTNYNEYAIMIMSKQKSTGDRSISLKLYSRTKTVRPTVLEDFKVLVRQQGMGDNTIFIKKDKGDCVPGEQVAAPTTQSEPQRVRRNVVPSLVPEDTEGSGDDTPLFNGTKACNAAPDTGPCFGILDRFFYNSSSMSCELFKYGGCLGNQNNFKTERECLQRCRTEAVCRLPMAAQPCTGQPTIWAFDPSTGLCVHYKPGFCQSNANKFYTKSECEEYCGVVKDDDLLMSN